MKVEIRSDTQVVLDGYVNAVGRESRVLCDAHGDFVEIVQPGTFGRALSGGTVVGLMHDHTRPLGSTDDCLALEEDAIGLRARATINDPEIVSLAQDGKLTGWSFGFYVTGDEWSAKPDGMRVRTLTDIDLLEVSILDVTPAYYATSVEVRDDRAKLREVRSIDGAVTVEDHRDAVPAAAAAPGEDEINAPAETTAPADVNLSTLRDQKMRFEFDYLIKKGV